VSKSSWLKQETKIWVASGIITPEQASKIVSLYPQEQKNRLVPVLLILGVILFGAGIILFFAANWEYMPKWSRVAVIIGALIAFHLLSHFSFYRYPKASAALSLLACVTFGAGIWLVAQIFHINSHFPNGLLFWFLGTLPAAYLLEEKLPLVLSALLLGLWVAVEHSTSPGIILLSLALLGTVFYLTYKMKCPFALVFSLLSSLVFLISKITLAIKGTPAWLSVLIFLLLSGQILIYLSENPVNQNKTFSKIYALTGLLAVVVSLYVLSLAYVRSLPYPFTVSKHIGHDTGMLLIITVYILTGVYLLVKQNRNLKNILTENFTGVGLYLFIIILLLNPFSLPVTCVLVHLVIFVWALSIIWLGYRKQDNLYFTLGLVAFNVFTVTEYFNLAWNALPKSLFFLTGGLVLILGGFLMERNRRKVIHSWQDDWSDA